MRGAEAHRKKIFIDAALGVGWSPTGFVLEQSYCSYATIGTEVEPVQRASRYADQIACLDFDREHRAGG